MIDITREIEITRENDITILAMNNPPMNVLSREMLEKLKAALEEVKNDGSKAVILTGKGRAFVAGADISEMKGMTPAEAEDYASLAHSIFTGFESLPKPVIAVVNGFALGGGNELAMACDMIIASEKAKFGQPEVNLGVMPGFGGTQRLARICGKMAAMELIMTADIIPAAEALRIGLVNRVVPPEDLMDTARKMASKIAAKGPVAVKLSKLAINGGLDMPSLGEGLELETKKFGECFATGDLKEGMGAFLEKRKPEFKGK